MLYYLKSVKFFMFQKVENMLLEAKSLFGRCHGNGIAIKVSLLRHKESIVPTFFGILKKSFITFSTGPAQILGRMLVNLI